MAIWPMGSQHTRSFSTCQWIKKFYHCSYQLFHQVDGSWTTGINNRKEYQFFMKIYHLLIGLPLVIIIDNGRQFNNTKFEEFCMKYHIIHKLIFVGHPQSNGEVEVTNRTILQGLKTRLGQAKKNWANKLYSILWSYSTTPQIPTGETLFKLTFMTEAMIPMEIGLPSTRIEYYDEMTNSDKWRDDLDLFDETRRQAQLKIASYQQRVSRYYNF